MHTEVTKLGWFVQEEKKTKKTRVQHFPRGDQTRLIYLEKKDNVGSFEKKQNARKCNLPRSMHSRKNIGLVHSRRNNLDSLVQENYDIIQDVR